ncbi:MAG: signal peptidase II [Candidatus Omnitrophica bacterium]|nr:signal peptidase II [Candidatus Omnitrophota bacterium]
MSIYAVSVFIVVFDQLTKFLALKYLSPYESIPLLGPWVRLTLVKNPGIAFGLFGERSGVLIFIVLSCLAGLIVLSYQMRQADLARRMALAFILGGAVGNLIDRVLFGHVIDFLDFRVWPVFNLADSFITVGVGLFLILTMRRPA